jgi:hypothetical protein
MGGHSGSGETPVDKALKIASMNEDASECSPAAAAAELRQLVEDMLEVSADGRKLAADLAQSIREIVNLQCDAIDARAQLILAKAGDLAAKV